MEAVCDDPRLRMHRSGVKCVAPVVDERRVNPIRRLLAGRTTADPDHRYNAAALRLQLLVAMAAADGKVQLGEMDLLVDAIPGPPVDDDLRVRLRSLLKMLLEAPPTLEEVVTKIAAHCPKRAVAEQLVRELVRVAGNDGSIDEREEDLLRMVCAAMGLKPVTMRRHHSRTRPLTPGEQARLDALLRDAANAA